MAATTGDGRHEARLAAAAVCASLRALYAGVGCADGDCGRDGRAAPVSDQAHLRQGAAPGEPEPRLSALPRSSGEPLDRFALPGAQPLSQCVVGGGLRVDCLGAAEVHLRLHGHIPGELRGLRHDYRPAQRPVRRGAAALGCVLPEALDRHVAVDNHQRHRAGAVCHVDHHGRFSAAILYPDRHGLCCDQLWRKHGLGAAGLHRDRPASSPAGWTRSEDDDTHGTGQAGGDPEHRAGDDFGSRATASSKPSTPSCGRFFASRARPSACSAPTCAACAFSRSARR